MRVLPTMLLMLPDEYVTKTNPEREEYLASLSPEELLQLGIDLYNAGHFWHAHEAWEEVWLEAPREMRHFYQGLIQVAAAFVHLVRNEYPGGVKLLEAGIEKLERYPVDYLGLDAASLLDGARKAYKMVLELGEKRVAAFDRTSIPRINRAVPRTL
jgi:uncharacterized protein